MYGGIVVTKDLLSVTDLDGSQIEHLLTMALELKQRRWQARLKQRTLVLLFDKPSLRTRLSFELAMRELGGESFYFSGAEVGLGQREAVSDVAQVLSRYADAISCRTFAQSTVSELAKHATVPVVNALTDYEHPCQALADLLTIKEYKGGLPGVTLAYVGDSNNVARSLMLAAAMTGMNFRIASPAGYQLDEASCQQATALAGAAGGRVTFLDSPTEAVTGADVVYTDTWTSMGQEAEAAKRRRAFEGFQVNPALMQLAHPEAIIMHCLPAHYGEEVAEGMLDLPPSVVFDQAEKPPARAEGSPAVPAARISVVRGEVMVKTILRYGWTPLLMGVVAVTASYSEWNIGALVAVLTLLFVVGMVTVALGVREKELENLSLRLRQLAGYFARRFMGDSSLSIFAITEMMFKMDDPDIWQWARSFDVSRRVFNSWCTGFINRIEGDLHSHRYQTYLPLYLNELWQINGHYHEVIMQFTEIAERVSVPQDIMEQYERFAVEYNAFVNSFRATIADLVKVTHTAVEPPSVLLAPMIAPPRRPSPQEYDRSGN